MIDLPEKRDWIKHSDLLKSVSRSFFLSVKFLPGRMREPVALGYLLARLSDTIADSGEMPLSERKRWLERLQEMILHPNSGFDPGELMSGVEHQGERALISASPQILSWLHRAGGQNQLAIQKVLKTIIAGQTWDLEHFETGHSTVSKEQLLEYTYRVAGCVGEFWTEVGFINLGSRFARIGDRESMMISGKELGQGLQLINIIRDLHEDIPAGRNYLPDDDISRWLSCCRNFLAKGEGYVRKVRSQRVKFATALPLYLAEATADKLESAGEETIRQRKVKVPRSMVWKMVARASFFS